VLHGFDGRTEGRIEIAAEAGEPGWVTLRLSDDGCGISLADQDRIFDPFFTTKLGQGGSGLGLHIVYNLATNVLGGKMMVSSTLGQGSVFTLNLPLIAPVSTAADGA
jgi:signal transduction histidine kinase